MCRLCLVAPKRVHQAGFHPTAVFGALGAAAGVASALRLDATQWFNALGIAGSMASGIIEYLAEGAWTKRMHPGWAAQAGYRAARMAQAGFTGPRTLFDGEHGFFHAFANSDGCDFTAMLDGAGKHWLCADIAFKPYACGTMAHPYIDCARKLVAEGVAPGDVTSIECKTAEGIVHRLWEPLAAKQNPPNGYAAKFSIPYAIAVGMLRGDAGLDRVRRSGGARPRGARACGQGALRRRSRQSLSAPVHRPRARHAQDAAKCARRARDIFAAGAKSRCRPRRSSRSSSPTAPTAAGTRIARAAPSPCCARCAPRRASTLPTLRG